MQHQSGCPKPGESVDEFRARFIGQIDELVAMHGHAGVQIMGDTSDETYVYSVGLQDAGWAELVVTSMNPKTGLMIINEVVSKLRSMEKRPEAGMIVTEAINVPVELRPIPPHVAYKIFKVAMERANRKGLPDESVVGLQIVWADDKGNLPGAKQYNTNDFPQRILENE